MDWWDVGGQVLAALVATALIALAGVAWNRRRTRRSMRRESTTATGLVLADWFSIRRTSIDSVALINRTTSEATGVEVAFDDPAVMTLWAPDWRPGATTIRPDGVAEMRIEGFTLIDTFVVTWTTPDGRRCLQEMRLP